MNSKTLKLLRATVRRLISYLPVRGLDQPTYHRMVPDYDAGLNLNGTPKMMAFMFPRPATNTNGTQRSAYRRTKKLLASGGPSLAMS